MANFTPHIKHSVVLQIILLVVMSLITLPLTLMNHRVHQHVMPLFTHPVPIADLLFLMFFQKFTRYMKKYPLHGNLCVCKIQVKKHGIRVCYRCGDTSHKINDCTFGENTKRAKNIRIRNEKWEKISNSLIFFLLFIMIFLMLNHQ